MEIKAEFKGNDVLAVRRAGATQYLVAHMNKWEGKDFFHLRLWHKKTGQLRPGKVGLTLNPDYFMTVWEVVQEAKETLERRAMGLTLVGEDEENG